MFSEAFDQLNLKDQAKLSSAFAAFDKKVNAAQEAGGVTGADTLRVPLRAISTNQIRIDIVIHTPNTNVVY